MTPGGEPSTAGFVLAGGQSRRMGTDKAFVELGGRPLIAHACQLLERAGLPAAIAGARSDLSAFGRVVPDETPDQGPLRGVCSALASTTAEWAVFVSVDLPLLPPELLVLLVDRARRTGQVVHLVSLNGFVQTFPVVLRRAALPALRAEMNAGRLGCFAAFAAAAQYHGELPNRVAVELLVQTGQLEPIDGLPPARWFQNVNTPADASLAEAYLSRRDRVS